MSERDIDEIAEKVCSSIYIQENHLTGETSIVGLENVKVVLQEERKQAAVEAATVARECKNFTGAGYCDVLNPANKGKEMHDYGRGGCDAQRVIVRDICLHFNLTDEDLPKEVGNGE